MPAKGHQRHKVESVACGVLTVSDTRTVETDRSGQLIQELLLAAGHTIHSYALVKDEPDEMRGKLAALGDDDTCQAVILSGGTGIAPRDITYETIVPLLDKRLEGFGELFRAMSFQDVGPAAMLSRALAGVMGRTAVFAIPGSPGAVRLATESLILPEIGHIVYLLNP